MSKTYCYIRISTDKQDEERQTYTLKENGYIDGVNCEYCIEVFTGKTIKRPVFEELIQKVQPGDTIVATELSRISRSVKDFNNLVDELLQKKKVNITILKENFHLLANGSMDAMTRLVLHITSAFAEFERDIISDRTKQTLQAKKINGTKSGRPIGRPTTPKASQENFVRVLEMMVTEKIGQKKASIRCGFPEASFKKRLAFYYEKFGTKNYKEILDRVKKEGEE